MCKKVSENDGLIKVWISTSVGQYKSESVKERIKKSPKIQKWI